jgi:hypothetical protein
VRTGHPAHALAHVVLNPMTAAHRCGLVCCAILKKIIYTLLVFMTRGVT